MSDTELELTEVNPKVHYDIPRENAVPPVAPTMSADTIIDKYRRLRAKKEEIIAQQKALLAQYNAGLEYLEGMLLSIMNTQGVDSLTAVTTDEAFGGTVYKTITSHTNVSEWHKTLAFIQEAEAWELLEPRVSKTVVLDYLEKSGELVPGVTIVQRVNVNVRKK